jgi:hypothetical protein
VSVVVGFLYILKCIASVFKDMLMSRTIVLLFSSCSYGVNNFWNNVESSMAFLDIKDFCHRL